jgi:hypothetical protein
MMSYTVEQGSSEAFVTQHLYPIGELEVGGENER